MNEKGTTSPSGYDGLFHFDYYNVWDGFGGRRGWFWGRRLQGIDCLQILSGTVQVLTFFASDV
jgi:hypothetical protein